MCLVSGQGTVPAPHQPPVGLKLCRHWGWERDTVTALEAGETNCETEKCCQPQMFARNTFIQLLSDGSKALAHNTCAALHLVLYLGSLSICKPCAKHDQDSGKQ